MSGNPQRERLFDLLADRALAGLDPAEDEELARLMVTFADAEALARDIELAAAAVAVAGVSEQGIERMPPKLLARLDELSQDGMPTTVHRAPDLLASAAAAAATRAGAVPAVPGAGSSGAGPGPAGAGPGPAGAGPGLGGAGPGPAGAGAGPAGAGPGAGAPTPETPKALKQTFQMPSRPGSAASVPPSLTKTLVHPQAVPAPVHAPAQVSSPMPLPSPPSQPGYAPPPGQVVPFRPAAAPESMPARARGGRGFAIAGWLAAAACLMLAVGAWYFRPRTEIVTVTVPAPSSVAPLPSSQLPSAPAPTPEQERDALLARAGTARLEWAKNAKDPASKEATGDVVWNAAEQRGYMRFRGLAKNDKRASVYQLWIFDKTRDDEYPVDGGVFDVEDDTGDVIVPIKAKLPVGEVALFAVTVEKPGGVVVSKRERIVVTAKPAS